ncbi:hypothetical protein ACH4UM_34910 [Streptomyces sp. NPDC020801]|uniref:hypothetical protein n=1 Tax=Streptomyces sp. NPDC020801 TaxID=3365093 RepID=UPI0037AB6D76
MSNDGSGSRPAYVWSSATVGSEGGPLLVCAADAFSNWGGAVHGTDYELDPACDYARAWSAVHPCDDDDELEAAFVRFGDRREHGGLIWEMDGEGSAEIALAGDDGFLLMRSWVPRDRTNAPHRRAAGASAAEEEEVGVLELRSGQVVVVWAAVGANEIGSFVTPQENDSSLSALTRLNPPVQLNLDHRLGVGTVLWVKPGTYRVTCGWHEGTRGRYMPEEEWYGSPQPSADDDWSCRWVRFTPSDDFTKA